MTIFLPDDIDLFSKAFDAAYTQTIKSTENKSFYALYTDLTSAVRNHTLLKDFFIKLETQSLKKKEEFAMEALAAVKGSWLNLWKYHNRNLKYRKQLVEIKRLVTAPKEIGCSPLYSRILSRMWDFRYRSPFCRFISEAWRFFKHAQYELIQTTNQCPLKKGCFPEKHTISISWENKNRYSHFYRKIFKPKPIDNIPFKRSIESISEDFFCLEAAKIEKKFFIPGQSNLEKRKNMQIQAKINPIFCWERICLLQECNTPRKHFPIRNPLKGPWEQIEKIEWKTALNRCEEETLIAAKAAFVKKLSKTNQSTDILPDSPVESPQNFTKESSPFSRIAGTATDHAIIDTFVMLEYQIHRRDYEIYLEALKNYIQTQLFRIQDAQKKAEESPLLDLPGTQKEDFVIDLARKFWKTNPLGKRKAAFEHYMTNCPFSKLLSIYRWAQIIRERKLDPRPLEEKKKRGPGKKTCKK